MALTGTAQVKVEVDTSQATRSVKQLEFAARKAARAVARLEEILQSPDAIAQLEAAGFKVTFVHKAQSPKEGTANG